ncbi:MULTISPECIES: PilZ domain-containing protein [unclassified Mesorhizobium]|uniref:PilZ domain-containing protein n=1 Tax=unclassified Mesorhizobium TaxID=325217 RepID=UPI000FCB0B90|nr:MULTISPECIES: PilZ domain-containing protein [unclassified Mesorhizobium]TIW00312.1 MAG: PilZ domain-containing protein [Mesorhizobium sp.]TGP20357.1 PilZ domain-containing protein [Mesorhizobium sp. M1D.F.Ca.ET.231.01.1.1]TGP27833.1 PilZ domain-containing protein [Mesorhizobium sp. M1D.F.Ca.ET.234.01.1.1]TGS42183.1 PilZ domain-containing protein [Mesorhizobium sp. M1D.F.Ca.ET.184.01.1.1]TGS59534.1 PilZ domain-containing protein [Mesorhizobium sp. M1D.F.Ca.ET.183.01.1.1]
MATFPHTERRLHSREFVLKEATIVTADARIRCSIRNQHEHGAELRVGAQVEIPEGFTLIVPDDDAVYRAVVRWRRNERVGVQMFSNSMKG